MYNLTNVSNANNLYETFYYLNLQSDFLIGVFLLCSIFLLIFIVFKKYEEDTKQVLLVDSTITTVLAVLFWAIDLITWQIFIFPVLMLFASIMIFKLSE